LTGMASVVVASITSPCTRISDFVVYWVKLGKATALHQHTELMQMFQVNAHGVY
jgi:hypothetical protein